MNEANVFVRSHAPRLAALLARRVGNRQIQHAGIEPRIIDGIRDSSSLVLGAKLLGAIWVTRINNEHPSQMIKPANTASHATGIVPAPEIEMTHGALLLLAW